MREIKFRAKRIDADKWPIKHQWVYGYYFKTPLTDENSGTKPEDGWFFLSGEERHCIVQDNVSFVIDINTLGQFTGHKDQNANEIFIGDLVKFDHIEMSFEVTYDWLKKIPVIVNKNSGRELYDCHYRVSVIGNVFDMPDWDF